MQKIKKKIFIFLSILILVSSMPMKSFAEGFEKIKESNFENEAEVIKKKTIEDVNESTGEKTTIEVNKNQENSKNIKNQLNFDSKIDLRLEYKNIVENLEITSNQEINTKILEKTYEDYKYITRSNYKSKDDIINESPIKLSLNKSKDNLYVDENKIFVNANLDLNKVADEEIDSYTLVLQKSIKLNGKVYRNDDLSKIKFILSSLDALESKINENSLDESKLNEQKLKFAKLIEDLRKIKPIYNLLDYGLKIDENYVEEQKKYIEKHKSNPEKFPLKYNENYYAIKLVKDKNFSGKIPLDIKFAFSFNDNQIFHGDLLALEFTADLKSKLNIKKDINFISLLGSDLLTDPIGKIQKRINDEKIELEKVKKLIDFETHQDSLKKSTFNIDYDNNVNKTDNIKSLSFENKEVESQILSGGLLKDDISIKSSSVKYMDNIQLNTEKAQDINYKDIENSVNIFASSITPRSFYYLNNNVLPVRTIASDTTKLTVNKKDENGSPLKNAKFKLSGTKLDGTQYSVEKISEYTGVASFDGLQPGNYILEEVLPPENYKKISTQWSVYVSPNGAIFVNEKRDNVIIVPSEGQDVSKKISGNISINSPDSITIGDGKTISVTANLNVNGVKENDYFDVKFSPNIHYNMLQYDKPNQPTIVDSSGKVIARPKLIKTSLGGEKIIRYTFTVYVNDIVGDLDFDIQFGGYSIDYYNARNAGNQNITVNIGSITGSKNVNVLFDRPSTVNNNPSNPINIDTSFYYTNDQNGKYTHLVYVNPLKNNINISTNLEITPYINHQGVDKSIDNIVANIDPINTTIKIYKLKDVNAKFDQAVIFDETKLIDVTTQFNGKINIINGKATISFSKPINSESYLVKIDSNMKYPTGVIQGTFLAQTAVLRSSNAYVSKILAIAVNSGGTYGSGTSYIRRKASLDVTNLKEKSSFEIEKVDSKNNAVKLENAKFSLTKLADNGSKTEIIREKSTGSDGKLKFDNLENGSYLLEETKAPDGYRETFTPIKILISGGKVYQYKQKKEAQSTIPDALKTDKSYNGLAGIKGKIVSVDEKNNTFIYRLYANDWTESNSPVYFYYNYQNPKVNIKTSSNVTIESVTMRKVHAQYAIYDSYLPKVNIENFNSGLFYDFQPNAKINFESNTAQIGFGNVVNNGYIYQLLEDGSVAVIDFKGKYTDQSKIDIEASFSYDFKDYGLQKATINNSYTEAKEDNRQELQEITQDKPLTITNDKELLVFEKLDSENNDIKLNGVKFELRKKSGEIIKEYYSNIDGKVSIDTSELRSGDYELHEIKALEGYKLPDNSEVGKFTINNSGKIINISPQDKVITNIPLGENKVTVKKKDEKDIAMSNVQFKLVDSRGHTVAVKNTNSIGEVEFDKLPFGEYSLVELKSKEGYILDSKPKKILIGKDFEIPNVVGNDVSDRVSSTNSEFIVDGKRQAVIKPRNAEQIIVRNTFQFGPGIKPGDYFIVDYSENVDVGGLSPNQYVDLNIVGTAGLLAKGEWIQGTHSIKYTFTEYISNYRVNEANLTTYIYIDFDTVKSSGNQWITQKIGSKIIKSKQLMVDYSNLALYDNVSGLGSTITEYDGSKSYYKHVVYLNPYGSRMYYGDRTVLSYMFDTNGDKNSSAIINNTTKMDLYLVNNLSDFAESYSFDTNGKYKLREGVDYIRQNYNGTVEINFINYKPIDGHKIALVVDGKMDMDSDKPLNPSVKLYNTWIEYDVYGNQVKYNHGYIRTDFVTKQANISETEGYLNITLTNYPNVIEFTKKDISDDKRKDFSGVNFELRYSSNKDGIYEKVKNSEKTTTKDGKIFYSKLKTGFYQLFETKTWQGYKLPIEAVAKFEVNIDGEIINITPENKIIENSKSETGIEFVKIDGKTRNDVNPNYLEAEFTLYKWDDASQNDDKFIEYKKKDSSTGKQTNENYTVKSDKLNGIFKFDGLEDGKYAVKETKAPVSSDGVSYINPSGYITEFTIKDSTIVDIVYKNSTFGEVKKVSVDTGEKQINYVYNYKGEYPSTGGFGSEKYHQFGGAMMVISLLYIYLKRKKMNIN